MSTDVTTEADVLDVLDFEIPCQSNWHGWAGSGGVRWAMFYVQCCPRTPKVFCEGCKRAATETDCKVRCRGCGLAYDPVRHRFSRIEPLAAP